jgi:homoserine O-succinyltransferase
MPLVAHNNLPTFQQLEESGELVLSLERATRQDIRELHIGFLNMMPDAALAATEYQFIRFIGACNQIAQIYVYPFSLPELSRSERAKKHIAEHYFDFATLATQGLDALIITGANVSNPLLEEEEFWKPLMEVVRWAENNVASVLCSCLATHALVKYHHGIGRTHMGRKKWGVFDHRITCAEHPLMRDINTRFDAPHSRYNEITRAQLESAGLAVLAESEEAGVHLAVSPDLLRIVYFQGHPEYDAISLLKEYKREVMRFFNGEREHGPRYPENYFSAAAGEIAKQYFHQAEKARKRGEPLPPFPDAELEALVDNTWGDTGRAIVNNWLGLVYKLTNLERTKQFMPGVDPDNPLGLRRY